jgi:hypothetical protein
VCIIDEIEVSGHQIRNISSTRITEETERFFFSFKVDTKRSSNNKNHSKETIGTLGALVTGLTSTPASMSDEINSADTLIIKPTSIEINSQPNGNHHSPVKSPQPEIIVSSTPASIPIDQSVDSGLSSEVTNTEVETSNGDDEVSSIKHQRESSPISGVIIPEEKRVTDRVKVFEAVANNTTMTKNGNNNKKKSSISSSFTIADQKQVSPSSTESFDTQSFNEIKPSKNKSKKSSLKKQIQNLLKIDKPSVQDDDEQLNGKKPKKDSSK